MSVLRSLESKLAGLVEGTFSRAFKSEVRPVEIARKLAKEMDEHKVQSLSRVYAPNEYAVWLSPDDRKQFEGYEDELAARALRLSARARAPREDRARSPARRSRSRPTSGCGSGEFGIQARLRHAARSASTSRRARATRATRWSTRPPSASQEPLREPDPRRGRARLRVGRPRGARRLRGRGARPLARRDVVLDDPNVSRHHAEVRPSGGSWIVNDLGSTNGIKVNGRRVNGPQSLKRGDVIELGTSRVTFELE